MSMRAWSLIVALIAGFVTQSSGDACAQMKGRQVVHPDIKDYQIAFRLAKDAVVPYQSLWVRECITNLTAKEIPLPNLLLGGSLFKLSLSDSSGRLLPLSIPQGHFGRPFTDERISVRDSVVNYCDLSNTLWDPLFRDASLPEPGLYYVQIVINQSVFSGNANAEDSIVMLPFRILPFSDQELDDREAYVKAYHSMTAGKDIRKSKELLRWLINQHPESALREAAYQLLFFIDGNKPSSEGGGDWISTGKEILRSMPESPYTCEVAMNLKRALSHAEFDSLLTDAKSRSSRSPLHEVRFQKTTD